jgi:hypothetical protein
VWNHHRQRVVVMPRAAAAAIEQQGGCRRLNGVTEVWSVRARRAPNN